MTKRPSSDSDDPPARLEEGADVRAPLRPHRLHSRIVVVLSVLIALVLVGGAGALWVLGSGLGSGGVARNSARPSGAGGEKTVQHDGHTYALNDDMTSVAVIGFDQPAPAEDGEEAGQADVVEVVALDKKSGKATVIVIPRDSMVEVATTAGGAFAGMQTMQICLSYGFGDGRDGSCQNTASAASRVLFNMPIDYYFALDLSGLGPLSDAAGGVALTPLQSIPGTDIVKGRDTVLFGDDALSYVQWRDEAELDSSLDRQARQAQFVKALASQALSGSPKSMGTLLDLYNTARQYSVSNLDLGEFSQLAGALVSKGAGGVGVVSLPGEMRQGREYAEFYLDRDGVYDTVLKVYYHQVD